MLDRVEHLRDLGVTAVELLPIQEFASPISRGYDGVDLYSPEMDYGEADADELAQYLTRLTAPSQSRSARTQARRDPLLGQSTKSVGRCLSPVWAFGAA